jgi:GxxExxY protein
MVTRTLLDELTYKIVGCAIEVHRQLGPGLLESVYQKCFVHELCLRSFKYANQIVTPINYKGIVLDADLRLDVLVEDLIIVELKSMEGILAVHEAQLLTYMKLLQKPKAFLSILTAQIFLKKDKKRWLMNTMLNCLVKVD